MEIVGFVSKVSFEELSEHLRSYPDVALMDPMMVFGKLHILSAAEHAERSFRYETNRSKTFLTEFLMYMAGERQISKALERMKPKNNNIVIVFFNGDASVLKGMGKRDDRLIDGTEEKAISMGLKKNGLDISYDDIILETVAMLDIQKN